MKPRPKPKYLEPQHGGQRDSWQISYSDFVTILLILFVAIAAQSIHSAEPPRSQQTAEAKANAQGTQAGSKPEPQPQSTMQAAVQAAPQAQPQPIAGSAATTPDAADNLHKATTTPDAATNQDKPKTTQDPGLVQADEKLRSQGVDAHLEKRGLVISLPQAILFPSGEDHIVASALPIVSDVAQVIASVPNKVALVGHADSVPIHNKRFHSNWELSAARSLNLLEVLRTRYGIPEARLSVQSYGSNDPKDSNDTAAGRAENRRVEILLLDESTQ